MFDYNLLSFYNTFKSDIFKIWILFPFSFFSRFVLKICKKILNKNSYNSNLSTVSACGWLTRMGSQCTDNVLC